MSNKELFLSIKKLSVPLSELVLTTKDFSSSDQLATSLETYRDYLKSIPSSDQSVLDPKLGDYVFFPLSQILSRANTLKDTQIDLLLQCIDQIVLLFWRSHLTDDLASQLCFLIVNLIWNTTDVTTTKSESTILSAVTLLSDILTYSSSAIFNKSEGMMFHLIQSLLDTALYNTDVPLVRTSLSTVSVLLFNSISDSAYLAKTLPGVCSSIVKLVAMKQHYSSLVQALNIITKLSSNLFADDISPHWRSEDWLALNADQFRIAFGALNLRNLIESPRQEVRDAITDLAFTIIQECSNTLSSIVPGSVELILSASADKNMSPHSSLLSSLPLTSYAHFELAVQRNLSSFSATLSLKPGASKNSLLNILKNSSSIISASDNVLWSVHILQDVVKPLAAHLSANRGKLIVSSVVSNELEVMRKSFQVSMNERNTENTLFLDDIFGTEITSTLTTFFASLTPDLSKTLLQDILTDIDSYTSTEKALFLWVSSCLIENIASDIALSKYLMIDGDESTDSLVADYLDYSVGVLSHHDSVDFSYELYATALLIIRSISSLKGSEFKLDLLDCLYHVASGLASKSVIVRENAQYTIIDIARNCGFSSVYELLHQNSDYLLNSASICLNAVDLSPELFTTLKVLISIADSALLYTMSDVINTLLNILDSFHHYPQLTQGAVELLKCFVLEVVKIHEKSQMLAIDEAKETKSFKNFQDIRSKLLQLSSDPTPEKYSVDPSEPQNFPELFREIEARKRMEELEVPTGTEEVNREQDETAHVIEGKEEEPIYESEVPQNIYSLVKTIVLASQYHLTQSSSTVRGDLLTILKKGMPFMASNKKDILPLINVVFEDVIKKLDDPEQMIVCSALQVLQTLMVTGKDFMSSRIKVVWRSIRSRIPPHVLRRRGGIQSPEVIILEESLNTVASILISVPVDPELFDDILRTTVRYLPSHSYLREAFNDVNGNAVYLEYLRCDLSPLPAIPSSLTHHLVPPTL
ncbi:hypothetical protein CANCADRAFT_59406 [Tortispora caseinolytica NRRL Y-17796]|uniref:TEL2-interacting protein 1 n=1 Tax=Tortispora caseinolytica NRRL Y-17796 TaxID=767744 RepID=A0A1E4TK54_9ASCO|nr:hypothetical protein CANCADRAFT_59406 [Tortispora caseinolytica NRRL Y-17796]